MAFLDEVEFCTQAILQYPEAGQLIVGTYAGDSSDVSVCPSVFNQIQSHPHSCRDESEAAAYVLVGRK